MNIHINNSQLKLALEEYEIDQIINILKLKFKTDCYYLTETETKSSFPIIDFDRIVFKTCLDFAKALLNYGKSKYILIVMEKTNIFVDKKYPDSNKFSLEFRSCQHIHPYSGHNTVKVLSDISIQSTLKQITDMVVTLFF